MKAVFEVTGITASWKPPFDRKKETNEYEVGPGQSFEEVRMNGVDGKVFSLKEIRDGRALIEYDRHFMRKDQPNARTKELWAEEGNNYEFSFLWGSNGITKKLSLKKVIPDD